MNFDFSSLAMDPKVDNDECNSKVVAIPEYEVSKEILPGIKWGSYCQLYTPAFWKYLYHNMPQSEISGSHRIGASLLEEIIACLLGGYGMPSEIGFLAFSRLKHQGYIQHGVSHQLIRDALMTPLLLPNGKKMKYRFFNQKSFYVFQLLNRSDLNEIPMSDDLALRNWLLTVDGIGPKTASWITRNWLCSEKVAILDIHIIRAGQLMGIYKQHVNLAKNYFSMEAQFLGLCAALHVQPSKLDALIWSFMKRTHAIALRALSQGIMQESSPPKWSQ